MRPQQVRVMSELGHHAGAAVRAGGLALAAWLDRFELAIAELSDDERDEIATIIERQTRTVRAGLLRVARARRAQDAEAAAPMSGAMGDGGTWASSRAWAWCATCGDDLVFVFDGRDPECAACVEGLPRSHHARASVDARLVNE